MKARFAKLGLVLRKMFLPTVAALTVVAVFAHFAWKYSGSSEWELKKDENGVRVYTMKTPGSTLLKVKADMQVATSLTSAVFLLRGDESTSDDFGGKDFTVVERIETPQLFMACYSAKHPMPPPFRTKEMVVMLNYAQDKATKKVEINVQAAPGRTPPSPNTSRVTHLNNIFRLTPLPNGLIDWEITLDVDMGLFYPLANLSMPEYLFKDLSYHKTLVLTEKYQAARLISVEEPGSAAPALTSSLQESL
ncbi:hypothetical protein [Steroidobacter cummioxidans]|uniref:hypothetical protein n=1 Tax=Steroidobacter cummioxidans TaxID=1803913 RepID=UPI000E319777|nr:hypothetical protein [Steroidobacter cummioxidans]